MNGIVVALVVTALVVLALLGVVAVLRRRSGRGRDTATGPRPVAEPPVGPPAEPDPPRSDRSGSENQFTRLKRSGVIVPSQFPAPAAAPGRSVPDDPAAPEWVERARVGAVDAIGKTLNELAPGLESTPRAQIKAAHAESKKKDPALDLTFTDLGNVSYWLRRHITLDRTSSESETRYDTFTFHEYAGFLLEIRCASSRTSWPVRSYRVWREPGGYVMESPFGSPHKAKPAPRTPPPTRVMGAAQVGELVTELNAIINEAARKPVDTNDMSSNHVDVRGSAELRRRLDADERTRCGSLGGGDRWFFSVARRSNDRALHQALVSALKRAGVDAWTVYRDD